MYGTFFYFFQLYLQQNMLSRIDMPLLAHWDVLTDLDIRQNPWTCECENQWFLEELIPIYEKINETQAKEVMCAAPIEMEGQSFYNLSKAKREMRCLDLFGNRPERDGTILVGILAGKTIPIFKTSQILILFCLRYTYWNTFGTFHNVCDAKELVRII